VLSERDLRSDFPERCRRWERRRVVPPLASLGLVREGEESDGGGGGGSEEGEEGDFDFRRKCPLKPLRRGECAGSGSGSGPSGGWMKSWVCVSVRTKVNSVAWVAIVLREWTRARWAQGEDLPEEEGGLCYRRPRGPSEAVNTRSCG
jgi:hypothetical protein